jgi:hypothetical protein
MMELELELTHILDWPDWLLVLGLCFLLSEQVIVI